MIWSNRYQKNQNAGFHSRVLRCDENWAQDSTTFWLLLISLHHLHHWNDNSRNPAQLALCYLLINNWAFLLQEKMLCTRKMTVYVISKKKEKKHYHKNIEIHKSTTHVLLALCKCDLYTPTNLVVVAPVLKYHLSAVHSKLTSTKVYTSPKQHSGW